MTMTWALENLPPQARASLVELVPPGGALLAGAVRWATGQDGRPAPRNSVMDGSASPGDLTSTCWPPGCVRSSSACRWCARPAPAISVVTDARGRVLASLPLGASGTLDTALPAPLPGGTTYARWGDLPFELLLALSATTALVASHRSRKFSR